MGDDDELDREEADFKAGHDWALPDEPADDDDEA